MSETGPVRRRYNGLPTGCEEGPMTYRGKVKNGTVILDVPNALPEGAEVSVRVVKNASRGRRKDSLPTLYERLKPFIGVADDLPSDSSVNHDRYLYGTPKNK